MTSSASSSQPSLSRRSSYNRHIRVSSGSSSASASSSRPRSSRGRSISPLNPAKEEAAVQMAAKRASTSSVGSTVSSSYSVSSSESKEANTTAATSLSASTSTSKIPADVRAMLFEEEYQEEVIEHMHHMELQTIAAVELMDVQPELKWFMRPYLVDFLIEIHQTFRLRPETLFLTMNIVDRYVSKRIVYKRHYQLVGCAALLIAAKFEDAKDRVPTVKELSQMCCNAYDESAFAQMEGHVLSTIGWTLGHPTAESWLRIESVRGGEDLKTVNLARFFLEVSLFHRDFISVKSSALTKGALILARFICGLPQSAKLLPTDEAAKAAHMLDAYVSENLQDLSLILIKKYSYAYFSSASTVVCDWYRARVDAAKSAPPSGLLPAQLVTRDADAGAQEADDDESMPTTPASSLQSTPSRSMDEDEDEDEEDDMPVTPLSLYSLHDPLVAAANAAGLPVPMPASRASVQDKENRMSIGSADTASTASPTSKNSHLSVQQPVLAARKPLGSVVWNVNVQHF